MGHAASQKLQSTMLARPFGTITYVLSQCVAIYVRVETNTQCMVQIFTVGVGVAYGQSAMLLSAGSKGKRFMLPHATALLQQPRVPPTGARQAIEVQIRWREAFNQYQNLSLIHI